MKVPALIVVSPRTPVCSGIADSLSEELLWRGFDPEVRSGRDLDRRAVERARLLALVFPAIPVVGLPGIALGGTRSVVRSMGDLDGKAAALLAVSPLPLRGVADGVARLLERAGARVVVADSVPPVGPRGALVDLAAECMVRITR